MTARFLLGVLVGAVLTAAGLTGIAIMASREDSS